MVLRRNTNASKYELFIQNGIIFFIGGNFLFCHEQIDFRGKLKMRLEDTRTISMSLIVVVIPALKWSSRHLNKGY